MEYNKTNVIHNWKSIVFVILFFTQFNKNLYVKRTVIGEQKRAGWER